MPLTVSNWTARGLDEDLLKQILLQDFAWTPPTPQPYQATGKTSGKERLPGVLERQAVAITPGGPGGMQVGISESLSQDTATEPFTRILGCSHCFRDCVRRR